MISIALFADYEFNRTIACMICIELCMTCNPLFMVKNATQPLQILH